MESALRYVLKVYLEEYIDGLDNIDSSKFPVTLKNLRLRDDKIREKIDVSGKASFEFTGGTIGEVELRHSWLGKFQLVASNVVLNLAFNPIKAVKRVMSKPDDEDPEDDLGNQVPLDVQAVLAQLPRQNTSDSTQLGGPRAFLPGPLQRLQSSLQRSQSSLQGEACTEKSSAQPQYCALHDQSHKRPKGAPRTTQCRSCRVRLQTNYREVALCTSCSQQMGRCMLCAQPGASSSFMANGTSPPRRSREPSSHESWVQSSNENWRADASSSASTGFEEASHKVLRTPVLRTPPQLSSLPAHQVTELAEMWKSFENEQSFENQRGGGVAREDSHLPQHQPFRGLSREDTSSQAQTVPPAQHPSPPVAKPVSPEGLQQPRPWDDSNAAGNAPKAEDNGGFMQLFRNLPGECASVSKATAEAVLGGISETESPTKHNHSREQTETFHPMERPFSDGLRLDWD